MASGPLLPLAASSKLPCSLVRARIWRRFSSLRLPVAAPPGATFPDEIPRCSSLRLRAPKPIVAGPPNRPAGPFLRCACPHFSRRTHWAGMAPRPHGRLNRGARLVNARWALVHALGSGGPTVRRRRVAKHPRSPGREARAERSSEPERVTGRGGSGPPVRTGSRPHHGPTARHTDIT